MTFILFSFILLHHFKAKKFQTTDNKVEQMFTALEESGVDQEKKLQVCLCALLSIYSWWHVKFVLFGWGEGQGVNICWWHLWGWVDGKV